MNDGIRMEGGKARRIAGPILTGFGLLLSLEVSRRMAEGNEGASEMEDMFRALTNRDREKPGGGG